MYNLHRRLVLLKDTMLIFILHILVQDHMESRGIDGVEKFLEPALFWRRTLSSILRRVIGHGRTDNSDSDEAEKEEGGDAVL